MKEEKIKEHIKNVPTYGFRSKLRQLRYKIANWLMDGVLDRTMEWYTELCELMDLDLEALIPG